MAKDTVIIIAVCAALAAAVALFLTVRVVRHCMRTSNPLPPPQPLAHHREQQLAKFENSLPRSQTWYQQNHIPAPRQFSSNSARASSVSLIPKTSPSLSAEDSLDYTHLPLPNPSFLPRPGSSSSYTSSETGHTRSTFTSNSSSAGLSSPPTPPLEQPIPRPHARSSSTPSRRSRPISTASSHSTIHSKTSRHTLRPGVPHGPHSQIQIVLPAPLSSDPYNQFQADYPSSRPVSRFDDGSYRKSVVDRWVSTGDLANLASMDPPRRTTTPTREMQRTSSAPAIPFPLVGPSTGYLPEPSLPPVPRILAMYKEPSISDFGELGSQGPP